MSGVKVTLGSVFSAQDVSVEGDAAQVEQVLGSFGVPKGDVVAAPSKPAKGEKKAPAAAAKPAAKPAAPKERRAIPPPKNKKTNGAAKKAAAAPAPEPEPEPEAPEPEEPEATEPAEEAQGADGIDTQHAALQDARRLREVVQHVMECGYSDKDEVVEVCEAIQDEVPLLQRVANIPERVGKAYDLIAS